MAISLHSFSQTATLFDIISKRLRSRRTREPTVQMTTNSSETDGRHRGHSSMPLCFKSKRNREGGMENDPESSEEECVGKENTCIFSLV